MRKRGQIWPEPSPEMLRGYPEGLAEALARVYLVLARPHPLEIAYCRCCVSEERVERMLHTPYRELNAAEVDTVLTQGIFNSSRWAEIAYFIPCLLEGFLAGLADTDALFYRILQAARPDKSAFVDPMFGGISEPAMPSAERQCLFAFFAEALVHRTGTLEGASYHERARWRESLRELLGFLAALDVPLEPVLRRWRDCYPPPARLVVSLILADLVHSRSSGYWVFRNGYARQLCPLPENEADLCRLLEPDAVMEYLASNTQYFWMLDGPREVSVLETAFDMVALAE